jgi:DNA repair protein RadC
VTSHRGRGRTSHCDVGCLSASLVHAREVFGAASVHKAAAIVLFHNHPSGQPEPSAEDLALTRRLVACGQLLGIEVLDHIVVGDATDDRWVSLRDRGLLDIEGPGPHRGRRRNRPLGVAQGSVAYAAS